MIFSVNGNIWPSSTPLRYINLSDLDFGLSMSLKVKCDGAVGLPIYSFLSMFHINIWSNSAPFTRYKASKSERP